jgi:hypothetical protein
MIALKKCGSGHNYDQTPSDVIMVLVPTVICKNKILSGSISLNKSYERFQLKVKYTLHSTEHQTHIAMHN